ncbi:MAG: 30S ribosomal protein S12 methylthiotransferase RimO [Candidatus Atribacteria bacterium]|nr:30S ribosomal protein S12 methylthiotransferase RimO [Candidatus Atribacteria bacterium]
MNQKTFHLTSLGCAKNSVDSDSMAQLLERDGYQAVGAPEKASILIVNTCGFIGPAREESYSVLRALAEAKRPDQLLIAAGCLTQRYGAEVARQVPGVDGILGTRRWMDIVEVVRRLRKSPHPSTGSGIRPEPLYHLPETPTIGTDENGALRASIAGASAYLKIADGCRRPCAFCAIPLIKGTTVSRPLEKILVEARCLRDLGIRELVLIAQDTTDYGHDLGIQDGLAILLEQMTVTIPDIDWIRIMYSFPGYVTDRLIDVMASRPQVLPYLDIPLQHAAPATLTRMRRPANIDLVQTTIAKMRSTLPRLAIRTTLIVGYPGETDEEFQTLLDFVEEMRFDRVGAFQFSFESGTASEALGDPVPAAVKEARYQRLMELQQSISLQINHSYVGQRLDVLIEGQNKGIAIGRSYRDAPEIDGLVLVEGKAEIGSIIPVKITGALAYDLTGIPVN